jgi:hypothetical protein
MHIRDYFMTGFMTAFATINAYQGLLYDGFMTAFATINAYQGLLYDGF